MFFSQLSKVSGSASKGHPQNSANVKKTVITTTKVVRKSSSPLAQPAAAASGSHGSGSSSGSGISGGIAGSNVGNNSSKRDRQVKNRHSSEPVASSKRKRVENRSTAGARTGRATAGSSPLATDQNGSTGSTGGSSGVGGRGGDRATSSPKPRKRRTAKSYNTRVSDESSSEEEENWELTLKKPSSASITATQSPSSDLEFEDGQTSRQFYLDPENHSSELAGPVDIISFAQLVTSTSRNVRYKPLFDFKKNTVNNSRNESYKTNEPENEQKDDEKRTITLQLPFGSEEYPVMIPSKVEEANPIDEIAAVFEMTATVFVPGGGENSPSWLIKHPSNQDCILRRLRRAVKNNDSQSFHRSIDEFNDLILSLRESGAIESTIKSIDRLPTPTIYELLNQVYRRVVSPRTHELRDYKAFSSNVYGELLPPFVTEIFRQTKLVPSSVFIDLGSGVGNCVLQAALEIGCESWGCEMMKTASELATKQKTELENRVNKLYRLAMGSINLVSSDFVQDESIHAVLHRADVLLVNNYAFDAELNGQLVNMFLDLKDGCKIVSLRSFVPTGHVITEHNRESPINILRVEKRHFSNDSVSWTTAGGDYYIATIDRSRLTAS
ncbi:histone methyltransferase DOT1 [Sugiyamaella lignohabitans]|uniref:Histone-lysine N-methyltransferase, H3 lysine-79 specific n=1 Tax=Sugiyamaella lignohabitans TaxID=796027 RepID=A0A167CPB5_9ASCO|nr:histone methyltransferase DOT1 [Sugiyamaella lignohabitans]ANB11946.1 histone methyltransferase DOT1 [Sugiyamaella lignohabitans]